MKKKYQEQKRIYNNATSHSATFTIDQNRHVAMQDKRSI